MAEKSENKSNINQQFNVASKGINLDYSQNNIPKGSLSYALNAALENFDSNSIQYQNEPGNTFCFEFPEGYKVIGKYFIPEKTKIIFWLRNEEIQKSEIGYVVNNDCIYHTLINDDCLNFDINRPILSVVHRILDNGEVELYWADNNGRRFLNIDDIPYIQADLSEPCDPLYTSKLDCNALLLQPDLNIPVTKIVDVISGGESTSGVYQFSVQYSDADGNPYTSYYNVTNPTPIADVDITTVNFNIPVGKSIVVNVDNLNPNGTYKYFNLAVIKTINNITSVELVGTYFIDKESKEIVFTGQITSNIKLTIFDIYEKSAFYEGADHVTAVQDILVWKGMKPSKRLNYQKIANQITLKWQSYRLPPDSGQYSNELNATNLRGYLRDEIYAFEIVFLLKNGNETDAFHIPGRALSLEEISYEDISIDNPDYIGDGKNPSKYWEVYNTAKVEGFCPEFESSATEELIIDYCVYELRQGGSDVSASKYFTVEYTTLDNRITTIVVTQPVQLISSLTIPEIIEGQGYISEIRCETEVKKNITIDGKQYEGPYQYGSFAYWESSEEYPCDEDTWGSLAGKKIRHHKFPDCRVSPIIENQNFNSEGKPVMQEVPVFPIGVLINSDQVSNIIRNSNLSKREKENIIGYKITRADRGVNKSIVAKGMLRNVNKYTKEERDYFYPNYPYNDVNEDPFLLDSNNAWKFESNPYLINIVAYSGINNGIPGSEFEYTNPDTNKIDKIWYYTLGVQEPLCSLTKPRDLGEGIKNKVVQDGFMWVPAPDVVSTVRDLNYDIWRCEVDPGRAGYRLNWIDPVEGTKEKWINPSNSLRVWTVKGRKPINISSGAAKNNERLRFVATTKFESNCKEETKLVPIKDNIEILNRQIFNSPETSFGQPFLGSILSLETVMYGSGKAHFVEVKDNAKYRLITKEAQEDALKTAEKIADITQTFSLDAMFAVYNAQLTLFRNNITKRNFAKSFNSIATYNYVKPIPNNIGIKNRNLEIKKYLISGVLNVGEDDININNYNRETSVYLKATETLPVPDSVLENYHSISIKDNSRFTIREKNNCAKPEKEEDISVVSYYGSLKNRFINQYGQIYSYKRIDTGFVKILNDNSESKCNGDIIWGGDTFIGRFSYKTKFPFFLDNRVKFPDDSDIFYDEIGNVGFPKYWHSSRSILETWQGKRKQDLVLTNFISYKAHNFDCPNDQSLENEDEDDPSINPNRTFYDGYFYMFAYGIPSFYCESSYNLDLRTALNNKEGDFWPHVSSGIPDDWVQEKNVPIVQDNTYNYNVTFSKQNKETAITNLPINWNDKNEIDYYPFRAVYSDKQISNVNNKLNNWLIYRPLSYFDFPQNYGNLTSLDGLKNSSILARFENKSLLYNSLAILDSTNPQAVYVGNPGLFKNQPFDFAETDQGYIGSQHKFMLKTPYGAVSCDAKRGHIFLINGTQVEDLTAFGSGMQRWFTAHLPFEILNYFPNIDVDNHFNGIGLHGVYDSNFERIIITKLDYVPIYDEITYENSKFFIVENEIKKEIYLIDSDYFCNVSWTLSFNFNIKSWVSFHSYLPNWFVGENNFFYSGLNYCPNDFDFLVGIKDNIIPLTTTTTTLPLTTTTSTTIAPTVFNCTFDASLILTDCTIEGEGVFLNSPKEELCERPLGLTLFTLYKGYLLNGVEYDTTSESYLTCIALNYYLIEGNIPNFEMLNISVTTNEISIGEYVYLNDGTRECNYLPDGWYFEGDTAEQYNSIFRIVDGYIIEVIICGDDMTTTTTTTTEVPVVSQMCYTGIHENLDPIHPLGGFISYIDYNNQLQTITNIWAGDYVSISALDIISIGGVSSIQCYKLSTDVYTETIIEANISANVFSSGTSNSETITQATIKQPIYFNNYIQTLKITPDYNLIVRGDFDYFGNADRTVSTVKLAKIDRAGIYNEEFKTNIGTSVANAVYSQSGAFVDKFGYIHLTGVFNSFNGQTVNNYIKLNSDGTKNTEMVLGTGFNGFTTIPFLGDAENHIYLAGIFQAWKGINTPRIAKIDNQGNLDLQFTEGIGSGGISTTIEILEYDEENILVSGYFWEWNGVAKKGFVVLNKTTGLINNAFDVGVGPSPHGNEKPSEQRIDTVNGGKIIIVGFFTTWNGISRNYITRINRDGSLDDTYVVGTGFNRSFNGQIYPSNWSHIEAILYDEERGKIVLGGFFDTYNSQSIPPLVRLNNDGSLDETFNYNLKDLGPITAITESKDYYYVAIETYYISGNNNNFIAKVNKLTGEGSLLMELEADKQSLYHFLPPAYSISGTTASYNRLVELHWKAENNLLEEFGLADGVSSLNLNYVPGRNGQAFSFNGIDSYINLGQNQELNIKGDLTIMAWINVNDYSLDSGSTIISAINGTGTDFNFHFVIISTGILRFNNQIAIVDSISTIPLNTWVHVCAVREGSTGKIYINAVLDSTTTITKPIKNSNYEFFSISRRDSQRFNGLIDDVRVINKALTIQEITNKMNELN